MFLKCEKTYIFRHNFIILGQVNFQIEQLKFFNLFLKAEVKKLCIYKLNKKYVSRSNLYIRALSW